MIHYLDKTFCPFHNNCADAHTCGRALTEEVKSDARRWWGNDNAPIAVYADVPHCHVKKEKVSG